MNNEPIRTDADHAAVLREIEGLWGAEDGTPEADRLDGLATLVDAYEDQRWRTSGLGRMESEGHI